MSRSTCWLAIATCLCLAACGASTPRSVATAGAADLSGDQLHALARHLQLRGDYTRAEQYAVSAMRRGVSRRRVLPLLLAVCVRAARYSAAIAHAEPELREHPDDHALRLLVATLHAALDRRQDALRQVQQVLAAAPNDPRALALQAELEGRGP